MIVSEATDDEILPWCLLFRPSLYSDLILKFQMSPFFWDTLYIELLSLKYIFIYIYLDHDAHEENWHDDDVLEVHDVEGIIN